MNRRNIYMHLFFGMSSAVWIRVHLCKNICGGTLCVQSQQRFSSINWSFINRVGLHCQGILLGMSLSSSSSTVGVGAGVEVGVERQDGCRGSVAVEDDTGMSRLSIESQRARFVSCCGQRT